MNTVVIECKQEHELCNYFPVGYVPVLEYDMYDVGVQIEPSYELDQLTDTHINFHIAYFNPKFTEW